MRKGAKRCTEAGRDPLSLSEAFWASLHISGLCWRRPPTLVPSQIGSAPDNARRTPRTMRLDFAYPDIDGDEGHRGDLDEVGDVALFLADGGTSVLYIY